MCIVWLAERRFVAHNLSLARQALMISTLTCSRLVGDSLERGECSIKGRSGGVPFRCRDSSLTIVP
jgi:hypothetical protein